MDSGLIPKLRSLLKKSSIKPIPKNNHLYFQVFRLYVGFLDGEESVGSWTVLPCCRLLNFLPEINEDIGSLWQQHRLLQDQLLYRYAANFQCTLKARAVGDSWMAWKFETHRNSKSLSLSLSVNLTMPIPKDFWTAVWSIDADMLISKRFQPGQAFACTLCETLPTFTTAISASVTPLIFVGIYSAAGNFAKREAIRRTWSRIFEQQGFQVKFFLGVWAGCFSFFSGKIE